ncbi:tripartite motif-containing protein 16-like [Heptranchias perlo]|uniref:tripartite motif-containing protein 16-like n=1 Tax=Heptranchias perlo TaxID=212740 RepID=UPI003559E7E6
MASSNLRVSEEKLICAICLEVFRNPATIPCGHNFCLDCIGRFWDQQFNVGAYSCPQCRESFIPRPTLHRNTIVCDIVEDFLKSGAKLGLRPLAGPSDVPCDFCTDAKLKAAKSCLVCLASYCEIHLKPHRENAAFQDHPLTDPVQDIKERKCKMHRKHLELFCRTDKTFICCVCTTSEHRKHEAVTLEEEVQSRKKELRLTDFEMEKQLQKTLLEIGKLQQNVDSITRSSQKVESEITNKFSAMTDAIEEALKVVIGLIEREERAALNQADSIRAQLEQRCTKLREKKLQLEILANKSDNFKFVQESLYFSTASQVPDVPQLKTDLHSKLARANDAATELSAQVKECLHRAMKRKLKSTETKGNEKAARLLDVSPQASLLLPEPKVRKDFVQYAMKLTFDPNTANEYLRLSSRGQRVEHTYPKSWHYPEHPERFDNCRQVMCLESSYQGKCYWEVQLVEGLWGVWADVGITYKRMNRKGRECTCYLGRNDVSWCLEIMPPSGLLNGLHRVPYSVSTWHNKVESKLPDQAYNRIGIFLDYPAGTLSFYGVAGTMKLLHRFQAVFKEPLYPVFWIGSGTSLCICQPK